MFINIFVFRNLKNTWVGRKNILVPWDYAQDALYCIDLRVMSMQPEFCFDNTTVKQISLNLKQYFYLLTTKFYIILCSWKVWFNRWDKSRDNIIILYVYKTSFKFNFTSIQIQVHWPYFNKIQKYRQLNTDYYFHLKKTSRKKTKVLRTYINVMCLCVCSKQKPKQRRRTAVSPT